MQTECFLTTTDRDCKVLCCTLTCVWRGAGVSGSAGGRADGSAADAVVAVVAVGTRAARQRAVRREAGRDAGEALQPRWARDQLGRGTGPVLVQIWRYGYISIKT